METNTASNRMFSIIALYDLHTDYFQRALEGISDEDAHNRLNTKANHIAWLAGSFVYERFEMAKGAGVAEKTSIEELFKDHKGIQDGATYPSLNEMKAEHQKISPKLRDALINVTDEQLEKKIEMGPEMTMTLYELITFMTYREANIIGQIALWRRLLGYEALKYM